MLTAIKDQGLQYELKNPFIHSRQEAMEMDTLRVKIECEYDG